MAAGAHSQAERDRRAFEALMDGLQGWAVQTVSLRMDELLAQEMLSPARRRRLAEEINQDIHEMLASMVSDIVSNRLVLGNMPKLAGWVGPSLPGYTKLSPPYLKRKAAAGRATPGYFINRGTLAADLAAELPAAMPRLGEQHIRVYRITARVVAMPVKSRNGTIHHRSQTLKIDASNRIAPAHLSVTQGWTVDVLMPQAFDMAAAGPFNRNLSPENTLGLSGRVFYKLQNLGVDGTPGTRPYRPLLGPYFRWVTEVAIPNRVRAKYRRRS